MRVELLFCVLLLFPALVRAEVITPKVENPLRVDPAAAAAAKTKPTQPNVPVPSSPSTPVTPPVALSPNWDFLSIRRSSGYGYGSGAPAPVFYPPSYDYPRSYYYPPAIVAPVARAVAIGDTVAVYRVVPSEVMSRLPPEPQGYYYSMGDSQVFLASLQDNRIAQIINLVY